ncbi:hypothetical protein K435DRAFT_868595 [Dendrothele bispora CBS 962.96]|uniref:Uncharacterized protein n=1 Tax=Dendrothele bispora (strain CBS 962.96) TaxID=1314807 RepID=A0A4V4HD70_DENBC|nr:hypothetical protein K435DRAFT_868595 [Dendrothele bispora CBS 962.96]
MSHFPRICEDDKPADKKSTCYVDKIYPKYILPVGDEIVTLDLLPGHTTYTTWSRIQPFHIPPLSLDVDNGLELNRSSSSTRLSLGNPILTPYPSESSTDSVDGPNDVNKSSSKLRKPLPPINRDQSLPAPYALVHENTGIANNTQSFQIFFNSKPFDDPSDWKEMTLDGVTLAMAGTVGSEGAIGTTIRLPTQPELSLSFRFTGNPPNLGIRVCWITEDRHRNILKKWEQNLGKAPSSLGSSDVLQWLYGEPSD